MPSKPKTQNQNQSRNSKPKINQTNKERCTPSIHPSIHQNNQLNYLRRPDAPAPTPLLLLLPRLRQHLQPLPGLLHSAHRRPELPQQDRGLLRVQLLRLLLLGGGVDACARDGMGWDGVGC
jgi:hypothetical protein